MRFANVHGQKIGVFLIVVVNLNDVANLAAKRRSSKTSEDKYERPPARSFTDMESAYAVQRHDSRVWRIAAHFQRATMHVRQGVADHSVNVLGTSRHDGQRDKSSNEQHAENARNPFPETPHAILLQPMNLHTRGQEMPARNRRSAQTGPSAPEQDSIEFNS
jgi:hypothetical protein